MATRASTRERISHGGRFEADREADLTPDARALKRRLQQQAAHHVRELEETSRAAAYVFAVLQVFVITATICVQCSFRESCGDLPFIEHGDNAYMLRCVSTGSCRIKCNKGYIPSKPVAMCAQGMWDNVTCLPARCVDPPFVANRDGIAMQRCRDTPSGGDCPLACLRGFVPIPPFLNCSLGEWTPNVSCQSLRWHDDRGRIPGAKQLVMRHCHFVATFWVEWPMTEGVHRFAFHGVGLRRNVWSLPSVHVFGLIESPLTTGKPPLKGYRIGDYTIGGWGFQTDTGTTKSVAPMSGGTMTHPEVSDNDVIVLEVDLDNGELTRIMPDGTIYHEFGEARAGKTWSPAVSLFHAAGNLPIEVTIVASEWR